MGNYENLEESRLSCMLHTVHLAALELLESIGAVKHDKKNDTYQDSVTAPVDRSFDDGAGRTG